MMKNYKEVFESLLDKYDHIILKISDGGTCFFKDGKYYRIWFERDTDKHSQLKCAIIPFDKDGRPLFRSDKYPINNEEDIINIVKSIFLTDENGFLIIKRK